MTLEMTLNGRNVTVAEINKIYGANQKNMKTDPYY